MVEILMGRGILKKMAHLVLKGSVGTIPTVEYDLFDQGNKVGFLQIRHAASHAPGIPAHMASHIYYEIEPAFRKRGYGKLILSLAMEEAKKIGLPELILTCYEENVASRKIIEANGGLLMEEVVLPETGKKFLKFKIGLG